MKTKTLLSFAFLLFGLTNTKSQRIATIAGNGYYGSTGDGGQATAAEIAAPTSIAFDTTWNLYISDHDGNKIRKVNKTTGVITTIAGTGVSGNTGDGGAATSARIGGILDIAVDRSGNLYLVSNTEENVRKVNTSGIITTIAGIAGVAGFSGDGGAATSAELHSPFGVAADGSGNVYIADNLNHRVRMINTSGIITTIAGNGVLGYSGDSGPATSAELNMPVRVLVDNLGNICISDRDEYRVRKINSSGTISTYAGNGTVGFSGDGGAATSAKLDGPWGVFQDPSGDIYIPTYFDSRIRMVNTSGVISTVAGDGTVGYSGDGGPATSAEMNSPVKAVTDNNGNLYIADEYNYRVRIVYLVLSVTPTVSANVTCYGVSTGSASVSAANGTTPYTYSWAPSGGTNSSNTALSAATYTVYVTDNTGKVKGNTSFTITQPSALSVSASAKNASICYGTTGDSLFATVSGGISPYTYSWVPATTLSCNLCQKAKIIAIASTTTYTVWVSDHNGCTSSASTTVTVNPLPTLTVTALNSDSDAFVAAASIGGVSSGFTYAWSLNDFSTLYTGSGDTAHVPVYPRNGSFAYTATKTSTGCWATTNINISHNSIITYYPPSNLPYPRYSKRGMYVEHVCNIIGNVDSTTNLVTYCKNNHITYVCLDGTSWNSTCQVFNQDSSYIDSVNAVALSWFIDSLKTRGGVEQVGILIYRDDVTKLDSNAYSAVVFNVGNFAQSVHRYNWKWSLPWNKKVDVLSLDEEFWGGGKNYNASVKEFHQVHMPMLKAMDSAAHICPDGYMLTEDYIAPPLNPRHDSLYTNGTQAMEIDSMGLYVDRFLLSAYTYYANVLYTRGDWIQADSEIGLNRYAKYYKKEVWPVFSAANFADAGCVQCWEDSTTDFSGHWMCQYNESPDSLEQIYFDSLSISLKRKVWTNNNNGRYVQDSIGKDTCFQFLGDMWFEYTCLENENLQFDTNTGTGAIHFYVTLPHDTQWFFPNLLPPPPIKLIATVHGGKHPFNYVWRDVNTGVILQSSNNDTLKITYSPVYPTTVSVMAVDSNKNTAIDYMRVYQFCEQPNFHTPYRPKQQDQKSSMQPCSVRVYPNPNKGCFNVNLAGMKGEITKIEVFNMLGEKVISESLNLNNSVIDMSNQPDGVYFYRVIKEDKTLIGNGKLMIEK